MRDLNSLVSDLGRLIHQELMLEEQLATVRWDLDYIRKEISKHERIECQSQGQTVPAVGSTKDC